MPVRANGVDTARCSFSSLFVSFGEAPVLKMQR